MSDRESVHEAFRVSFSAIASSLGTLAAAVTLLVSAIMLWITLTLKGQA